MKKQSINDISARALLAFDELQKTLYDKSIRLVETGFSQFFASLINKSDLIDGIHIDDTPFARIDKEHRGKILSQFFKKLNGQIIILSTDEEIVGDYRESISDIVSNTFVLNHTANGNTEILANTYFGGKHND